jgi:flagellar hook-basal body complex protein FliE
MQKPRAFIPKQDQRLPHAWNIKVFYRDGSKTDEFEGTHVLMEIVGEKFVEIKTIEDETHLILLGEIKRLSFDKRFNQAMDIVNELRQKAEKAKSQIVKSTNRS